jgi:hypothetical protein
MKARSDTSHYIFGKLLLLTYVTRKAPHALIELWKMGNYILNCTKMYLNNIPHMPKHNDIITAS